MLDRPNSPEDTSWDDSYWFSPHSSRTSGTLQASPVAVGSAYNVTTEDVLEVLGDDADELLASSNLEMNELVRRLNAETMMLPRIDAEMEAEIEAALAGADEPDAKGPKTGVTHTSWGKRFLRAAIGAVLLTAAGGGAAAASMNKTVQMNVDGKNTTVSTFSDNVGDVLESEGLQAGPHDQLSPSPDAEVSDGGKVVLDRGRQLTVTVDGVPQQHWVHSGTVGEDLRKLNVDTQDAWISDNPNAQVPLSGGDVQVKSLKTLTLIDGANKPRTVRTHAVTVGELLRSQNLGLGKDDSVKPGADAKIADGSQVMISRTGVQVVNKTEDIEPPTKEVDDDSMYKDEQKVTDEGTPGKQVVTYRLTKVNGDVTKREQIGVKKISEAKPKIVHVGTKERPQPEVSNEGLWDTIAGCESTNDWQTNSGNGYYGGLQFDIPTWESEGGDEYAPRPDLATKQEQIAVANRVKEERGLQPWECAGILGLR